MKLLRILATALAVLSMTAVASAFEPVPNDPSCLRLEDTVSLTGTVIMHKAEVVGHPSDRLLYALLKLDKPVCVSGSDDWEDENDVTVISLGMGHTWKHKFRATVTGRIWHAWNIWHRGSPVMMEVKQVKKH
jgi:hypothetical protein